MLTNQHGQAAEEAKESEEEASRDNARAEFRTRAASNKTSIPFASQCHHFEFKPFTIESLLNTRARRESRFVDGAKERYKPQSEREPDPYLASGQQLPPVLLRQLPAELIGRPIEDIDPFYSDKETFVIISRGKELTRFSASKALCVLGPFHPIRRIVLCILVNPVFNLLVMLTIITNCILMTLKGSDTEEKTEVVFTIVYTTEMGLKVLARGFIMDQFTYLRDPWNWLDFAVIIMAYLTIVIRDLGNLSVMRTFRVLRALKTVAIIPGMKTIVGAVIDSVKNLKDVVVLTLFSLSVFSLLGLQIYMGQLTQKCILDGPSNMTDLEWFNWCNESQHWVPDPDSEIKGSWRLCGNATGSQSCPPRHTCLQGFGPNPDYGYTNFDTFGWALICSFRLMTQDFWQGLYMQVLKTAGSWHIIFFIISIFLGSIYLMNLILAIVAMSYNELQRRAEEEEEAAAEEEAAFLESCRLLELQERASNESHGGDAPPTYRPSTEIGMMGQAFLANFCQEVQSFKESSDESREPADYKTISGRQSSYRSRSLCIQDSTTNANPKAATIGHPMSPSAADLTSSSARLRNRRSSRISVNFDYQKNSQKKLDTSSTVASHGRVRALTLEHDDTFNTSTSFSGDDSIGQLDKQNQLRQRAALIRIVSDDCSNKRNTPQAEQYTLNDQCNSLDETNHHPYKGLMSSSRSQADVTRAPICREASGYLQVDTLSMYRAKSEDVSRLDCVSGEPRYEYHIHSSPIGNLSRSEAAICGQPVSIHQFAESSGNMTSVKPRRDSKLGLAGTSNDETVSDMSVDSNHSVSGRSSPSFTVDQTALNLKMMTSLTPPKALRHLQVQEQPKVSPGLLGLNVGPQRLRSYNNVHQLTIDSGSQQNIAGGMHYLSVENFEQFGTPRRHSNRTQSSVSSGSERLNVSSQTVKKKSLSPSGTMSSFEQPVTIQASELESTPGQEKRSRQGSRAHIHPATMARSSFARPRMSIMPSVVGNSSARRMSQQDYIRRSSNWSRLSVSGNSDMRRLLRLWAHTNPYQWNGGTRSTAGSIVSHNNNINGNYSYSPIPSNANSPRPSSVGSARQAYELISALSRRRSHYGFDQRYGLPVDDEIMDEVSVNLRDKCVAYCLSCMDILCIWECCGVWLRIQKLISIVVFDPFTELFIILCILINTLFMALDSDDVDPHVRGILEKGNYFFTTTFAIEASMKIMALSPKFYFREGWNVFDAIIVALSLLELCLEGVYGLSVLRTFRLLRVFKLAKSWPTLNLLISIMGKAIGDVGNLTFVLSIIVFIFAVMGMQLFGSKYTAANFTSRELPRWNFTDFMHSFMIVFRILCAEWVEPMWDCLEVGSWPCIPFFLIAVTVGNLVVLNLFLALLLASFGASNLSSPQSDNVDTKKLSEAIARFSRLGRWLRGRLYCTFQQLFRSLQRIVGIKPKTRSKPKSCLNDINVNECAMSHIVDMSKMERLKNIEMKTELLRNKIKSSGFSLDSLGQRDHHNLSYLARAQAQKSAKSMGFYDRRLVLPSSTCRENSRLSSFSASCSELTNKEPYQRKTMIPIIVNEASEVSEIQNRSDCLESRRKSMASQDSNPSQIVGIQNYGSLSSSHSVENWRSKNIDLNHYVMEPIREDSRDAETSDDLSISTEKQQCTPEHKSRIESFIGSAETLRAIKQSESNEKVRDATRPFDSNSLGSKYRDTQSYILSSESISSKNQDIASKKNIQSSSSGILASPRQVLDMDEDDERMLQDVESYIEKCICLGMVCLKWFLFRRFVRRIVEHRYFDQCILILIVISSGTLALEDKHLNERPDLKKTLDVLDTIFTIIFSLEMILKWLAFGIRRYFGNLWSWLDFLIVIVSFVNLMASMFGRHKIQALKTMRTLRAMRGLRPLRALQRFQGMRVVVNALIQAIPSIFNVLLVCLIFWLIFSIMGVQMFGGKFWRCLNDNGELVDAQEVPNKSDCIRKNLTWSNPQINFDNVLNAYLALFQVATFEGWIDIMSNAVDSRARDEQPIREANIYMYFYFVFFVICGSFFTLNLFIGVIIDNFNEQKKKTGGSLEIFMTEDQKKYYHAMKKMKSKRPVKAMTRPHLKLQALLFDLTTSKKFDMTIMIIIGINMFVMALEHYGQSLEFSTALENLNLIFIAIFTLECLCKIFAMRHFYFREPWNIFDFIVVNLSILGVVMKEYVAKYFVSPTLLRVVRVVKVGRVLRLVKGAKGIRTLLFALAMSLPALFNICLLLFLVMFIYAIFGMSFFMNVRKRAGIDETFNFETFASSIIVLFQMSTSAGWDLVLDPLMDEEVDCQKPDPANGIEGTCGNKAIAIFYLISYVIVTFLIIINMYIAVILENYSQAAEDVQEGLTDDDYEMYYEIWQKFDPDGTQYLQFEKLSDFLDALEDPLRIAKPNHLAIVVLDINIYEGNRCYCVDILDALTKYFFTRKGLVIQVSEELEKVQSSIIHGNNIEKITTTYMIKREHYCARIIQNSWRKWVAANESRKRAD